MQDTGKPPNHMNMPAMTDAAVSFSSNSVAARFRTAPNHLATYAGYLSCIFTVFSVMPTVGAYATMCPAPPPLLAPRTSVPHTAFRFFDALRAFEPWRLWYSRFFCRTRPIPRSSGGRDRRSGEWVYLGKVGAAVVLRADQGIVRIQQRVVRVEATVVAQPRCLTGAL